MADELDEMRYGDDNTNLAVGKRIVKALESIDKRLADINETLASFVGEYSDPSSPGKTNTAVRTYETNQK